MKITQPSNKNNIEIKYIINKNNNYFTNDYSNIYQHMDDEDPVRYNSEILYAKLFNSYEEASIQLNRSHLENLAIIVKVYVATVKSIWVAE